LQICDKKVKKITTDTCYNVFLHETDSKPEALFTISKVAADWHELMIPQRTMRSSIARVSEELDLRFAASKHTTTPISHTKPSPVVGDLCSFPNSHLTKGRWLSWPKHTQISNLLKVACKWPPATQLLFIVLLHRGFIFSRLCLSDGAVFCLNNQCAYCSRLHCISAFLLTDFKPAVASMKKLQRRRLTEMTTDPQENSLLVQASPTRAKAEPRKHSHEALYGVFSGKQTRIMNTFIHSFNK